jgi:hypothetical protein
VNTAEEALRPLQAMLEAEDYHLTVTTGDRIRVVVTAGGGACDACLVPRSTLAALARDHLGRAGIADDVELDVVYPDD